MVGRGELTESAWATIEPLLPPGGSVADNGGIIDGHQRHPVETADRSALAGSARALWCRGRRVRIGSIAGDATGLWDRILTHVQTKSDAVGEVVWEVSIDSSTARAHQHASGARRRPSRADEKGVSHPADEGLGRSRGGLTTKFHLACDGRGRPLSIVITPGQRHDSTQLAPVLDGIRVPRATGRGSPRMRPDRLIADKGYSYPRCRRCSASGRSSTPSQSGATNERNGQLDRGGRFSSIKPSMPVATWCERCINRLKQWRSLATRYEKRAVNYRAMLVLASIVLWLEA